jgi:TIR domain-containing protein
MDEIQRAMRAVDFIIVCFSTHTTDRRGFFQKEVRTALDLAEAHPVNEPYIMPVRLEPVDVSTHLLSYQWIDYFQPDGIERLINSIKQAWVERKSERRKVSKGKGLGRYA